ncbi:hypothetical protein MMIC_P0421 [Mariprofundus micogutta]|uniref:Uncharacterized protein n=1 Tax=Mariprofundus micogutta TaxID=1921010 RepID=A0A1L8CKQ0_9PROT|nr:hypothetical protein MMIC_P0421 [Mariprofundus micogutta]
MGITFIFRSDEKPDTFKYYHFMAHYMGGELKERVLEQMTSSLESLLHSCAQTKMKSSAN